MNTIGIFWKAIRRNCTMKELKVHARESVCVRVRAHPRARVCICGCMSIIEAPPDVMLVESNIGIYREG